MKELLIILRSGHLYAHSAHLLVSRVPFFQDHGFFGEVYAELADDYDSIAERIIGLHGESDLDLLPLIDTIHKKLKNAPSVGVKENKDFFKFQLKIEEEIYAEGDKICKDRKTTEGTRNLVADIMDRSEKRQYKIKQRIK